MSTTNHGLAAIQHLQIVAEMMSSSATPTEASCLLKLLTVGGHVPSSPTIGDVQAVSDAVFFGLADQAEIDMRDQDSAIVARALQAGPPEGMRSPEAYSAVLEWKECLAAMMAIETD